MRFPSFPSRLSRGRLPWQRSIPLLALVLHLAAPARSAPAPISVEGIADKGVVANHATFLVPVTPGHDTVTFLDGVAAPAGTPVQVTTPDFHQLLVTRTPEGGGTPESLRIRFIVRDSGRGDSEWGLPPWTPPPVIPASPGELADATLRVRVPGTFPAGLPIPLVAWLDAQDGHALRASTPLESKAHPPILLRRGSGAGLIPAITNAASLDYSSGIPGHDFRKRIHIETAPAWVTASGTVSSNTSWPAGGRIDVSSTLTVPAGTTLSVAADTVVRLAARAEIVIEGRLLVEGTPDQPVCFVPASQAAPWGGFVVRGPTASIEARHAFFVDSGAHATWFDEHSGFDVHRREQALFLVDDGARVDLTDCAAWDGRGQFGHGRNGLLNLTRTLVQRFITGGEYNGGAVTIRDSALIEFPRDDGVFDDADNDAIYLTTGTHVIADSVIGWARDDGIDSGSGGAGSVLATNVWIEGNFHEAFAWSGAGRSATNLQCVAFRCGQGIECGWSTGSNSPRVRADACLSLGNLSGLRFGDNYDWTYNGFLHVTRSLVLHNHRDLYDRNWDDWEPRPSQLNLVDNLLTQPDPAHPTNGVWQPSRDASRLRPFLNTPEGAPVGIGLATRDALGTLGPGDASIPVALSTFAAHPVIVDFVVEDASGPRLQDRLRFEPGETLKPLVVPTALAGTTALLRVRLTAAEGGQLTGPATRFLRRALDAEAPLVATGAEWRYLDDGTDPGNDWASPGHPDSHWKAGPAELGYGDGDEATVIAGGPDAARHAAAYFRRAFAVPDPARYGELEIRFRRDDGGIVHVNGVEVFRSNVPAGPVTSTTYAGASTSSETQYFLQRIPASSLLPGRNVVAAEVHQANATSSDLSFDLELVGIPVPRLDWARFGDEAVLSWSDAAYRLQDAPAPAGPWQATAGQGTVRVVRPGSDRFYRLTSP